MGLFARLKYLFTAGEAVDALIREKQEALEEQRRLERSEYLQLCKRHQPISPGSHFAEHNCDYCRALKGATEPLKGRPAEYEHLMKKK